MAEGPVVETSHFQSDVGSIPRPGTKILNAMRHGQKNTLKDKSRGECVWAKEWTVFLWAEWRSLVATGLVVLVWGQVSERQESGGTRRRFYGGKRKLDWAQGQSNGMCRAEQPQRNGEPEICCVRRWRGSGPQDPCKVLRTTTIWSSSPDCWCF